MNDITTRADIENLIIKFYEKVKLDTTIGFIFNDVVKINWQQHIPIIADFWETILLDNPVYKKNAMEIHYNLNKKQPLHKAHFDSWKNLFVATVDEMFTGKVANLAKVKATSIADVMLFKMHGNSNKYSVL